MGLADRFRSWVGLLVEPTGWPAAGPAGWSAGWCSWMNYRLTCGLACEMVCGSTRRFNCLILDLIISV